MINIPIKLFCSIFLFLTLVANVELTHAGSKTLMISPVRVVFEGRQRTAKVNVSNTNTVPIKYRISLVTMRKDKEGKLFTPEDDNKREKLIKSLIRFSPRQATIMPGTRQVVKLMVRKPADLPAGEYQTRLRFMPIPDPVDSPLQLQDKEDSSKTSFNIDLIVGVTIPVVIQHGNVNTGVRPEKVVLTKYPQVPSGLAAVITLSRSGDYSAFGNVIVSHIGASGKGKQNIGRGEGLGIYIPDRQRTFALPLKNLENVDLTSGKLRVEFHLNKQDKRKPVISFKDFLLSP